MAERCDIHYWHQADQQRTTSPHWAYYLASHKVITQLPCYTVSAQNHKIQHIIWTPTHAHGGTHAHTHTHTYTHTHTHTHTQECWLLYSTNVLWLPPGRNIKLSAPTSAFQNLTLHQKLSWAITHSLTLQRNTIHYTKTHKTVLRWRSRLVYSTPGSIMNRNAPFSKLV